MKPHEVGPLNLGDGILPWLQRVNQAINMQPAQSRFYYAYKILDHLQAEIAEVDFLVDSEIVLGRDPTRPDNKRFLFGSSLMFFGKLGSIGYINSEDDRIRGLTTIFDQPTPVLYTPPDANEAGAVTIRAFETPVSQVTAMVSATV